MSKLNMNKKNTIKEEIASDKSITLNKAGGVAFDYTDPAEYLLGTIGSAMFVEPKYYQDDVNVKELKYKDFNIDGLDEQAIKIIDACMKIANGDNPKDLLSIAYWARKELNMRTTPQIMLAVAAKCEKTKSFVRKYVLLISERADEVKQVVGAYEHLFGWKGFPSCLKKGISDRMSKMSEYDILKYNSDGHPSFKDILQFCERRENFPFSKAMREYIMTGEVISPEATPMLAARKSIISKKEWDSEVPELIRRSGTTWEVLLSHFGNKKEVWEAVIPTMGYMALLRNIGNFLSADIAIESCNIVASKLSNKEEVKKSKQLPFRFLSAYRTLFPEHNSGGISRDRNNWNQKKIQIFLEAIETALDWSAENVPVFAGNTCIVADNSGSMDDLISDKSVITVKDAANVLCAILHRQSKESMVGAFGENVVWPPITKKNSILTNMKTIATYKDSFRGHATNAWKIFEHLIENKIKVDRIVIMSDLQCYNLTSYSYFYNKFTPAASVAEKVKEYQRNVNPNVFIHFFDLKGYGTKLTPISPFVNTIAGFSEKILNQILVFENARIVEGPEMPSLEYIRANY